MKKLICCVLILACASLMASAGKNVKIKLTGTANENIVMSVGKTGRTEVIASFPYVFEIPKDQLPINVTFESDNYLYYSIDIPKKPYDTTGHVYLVKINESAMAMGNGQQQNFQRPVARQEEKQSRPSVDLTKGVNAAPVTGKKSDNVFALIIANENYELAANVDNAINDGSVFKDYCIKTLGIPGSNVKYFTNLSYGKMRKAINDIVDIASIMKSDASVILYYAGHGIPDNKTKDAFLMPVDADGSDTDVCISLNDMYSKLNSAESKQCVVFLDACFSGAQRDGEMIMAARGVKLKPQEAKPNGNTIVFSATSGDEAAYSHKEENHGLFTYFILKKLQESKGNVSLGDLADYLQKNVSLQSRLINNNAQTPCVNVSEAISKSWKSYKLLR